MNVDALLRQYFSPDAGICIELFDDKNIQQVYRRLVGVLVHKPDVETSLLQAMSYCFYEVMDNVLIHSGKTSGIVITRFSAQDNLIQILVADDGMGIRASLAENETFKAISEPEALKLCILDKISDGKGMGFGLYSTAKLIDTAGHRLIIRSGNHTLSANGETTVAESEPWDGTIVYFELRSDKDIDPSSVVDYRTDPAEEFEELFLDTESNPISKLW